MGVGCAHGAGLGVSTVFNGIKLKYLKFLMCLADVLPCVQHVLLKIS